MPIETCVQLLCSRIAQTHTPKRIGNGLIQSFCAEGFGWAVAQNAAIR